ncbi:ABC transporter substrate-binding protein [Phaeovulum sp.]|uniref:ABC transporter substrate-binding protein n=1 Tax=Phaeovulum sp. TaxID=2934796 RepID=UPI00272FC793|nr:ABC transporter substrate-binding protein [Phaeovulum sp.]MDP1670182.1 ABC transporter substrate-binding protein [Phaeovulum sp.]MDP2064244.1 ABC transporter substrate-binding protein [Phaeovulum sp.]MDP3862354.1 ABC transporter substrate-binding protein [Phaeovulum sp.]MDZ4120322.1 ABC transporter substrate-binding protein [Phaeovulum sp.]
MSLHSLKRLSGAALLTLTAAAMPQLVSAKTLTISWWGFNGDKLNEFIVQPFQILCGCELVFETGNNADRLNKLRVRDGKGVDVIYLTDSFSQIGIEEGLFQPVDRALAPNIAGLHDIAQAPQGAYGPAYTIGRVGIVYDSAKVTPPITHWNDLWRADLAASISLPGITTTAGPMVVMLAGDKAGTSVFADPAPAWAEVAALKPNVVKNYNTGSEMINLFSTGEITVSLAQDFSLGQLQAAVPTVVWAKLEDGDYATLNTVNIPKGAENVELAHQFINFILDPALQVVLGEQGVDAPSGRNVVLSPEAAAKWTYGAEMIAGLKRIDYAAMNAAKAGWIDRWNEVFGM